MTMIWVYALLALCAAAVTSSCLDRMRVVDIDYANLKEANPSLGRQERMKRQARYLRQVMVTLSPVLVIALLAVGYLHLIAARFGENVDASIKSFPASISELHVGDLMSSPSGLARSVTTTGTCGDTADSLPLKPTKMSLGIANVHASDASCSVDATVDAIATYYTGHKASIAAEFTVSFMGTLLILVAISAIAPCYGRKRGYPALLWVSLAAVLFAGSVSLRRVADGLTMNSGTSFSVPSRLATLPHIQPISPIGLWAFLQSFTLDADPQTLLQIHDIATKGTCTSSSLPDAVSQVTLLPRDGHGSERHIRVTYPGCTLEGDVSTEQLGYLWLNRSPVHQPAG